MVRGIESRRKHYVEVVARIDGDGAVTPLQVVWDDGRRFEIDRVLDVRQAASLKVGGTGLRYLVRIGQNTTYLFYENPRWFVEARARGALGQPPPPYGDTMALGLR